MSTPYPNAGHYPTAQGAWDPENKPSANNTPPPYQEPYSAVPGQYVMTPMGHPSAVTFQPGVYITQVPVAHPEPDHLGYSIFTLLCCCLPIGIAALIYSLMTRDANNIGNLDLARKHSRTARVLNHTALGIGICILVIWIGAVIAINFIH